MSDTKFYKTIIVVEVLSEDPFNFNSLADVHDAISTGDCSGKISETSKEITALEMAKACIEHNTDPNFYCLNEDGTFWCETGIAISKNK